MLLPCARAAAEKRDSVTTAERSMVRRSDGRDERMMSDGVGAKAVNTNGDADAKDAVEIE